jgi:hypothetical protein
LATDGLSERGIGVQDPEAAVERSLADAREAALELRPLESVRSLVNTAVTAHRRQRAGDNVAAAVVWLDAPDADDPPV